MFRRNLLTSFFASLGLAKAQCVSLDGSLKTGRCEDPIAWHSGKAKNGQCPVCGTMAPKYHVPLRGVCPSPNPDAAQKGLCGVIQDGPTEVVARCKRCNAAFWQNAE